MKSIFDKVKQFIVDHQADIILVIGVILISLLSFAAGYIVAKEQEREPLKIEKIKNIKDYCSDSSRTVLELFN